MESYYYNVSALRITSKESPQYKLYCGQIYFKFLETVIDPETWNRESVQQEQPSSYTYVDLAYMHSTIFLLILAS